MVGTLAVLKADYSVVPMDATTADRWDDPTADSMAVSWVVAMAESWAPPTVGY